MGMDDIGLPPLPALGPLELDLAKYRALLSEYALTDEQADAILGEVGGFMVRCVESWVAIPTVHDIFAVLLRENSETDSVPVDSSVEPRGAPKNEESKEDERQNNDDN